MKSNSISALVHPSSCTWMQSICNFSLLLLIPKTISSSSAMNVHHHLVSIFQFPTAIFPYHCAPPPHLHSSPDADRPPTHTMISPITYRAMQHPQANPAVHLCPFLPLNQDLQSSLLLPTTCFRLLAVSMAHYSSAGVRLMLRSLFRAVAAV